MYQWRTAFVSLSRTLGNCKIINEANLRMDSDIRSIRIQQRIKKNDSIFVIDETLIRAF